MNFQKLMDENRRLRLIFGLLLAFTVALFSSLYINRVMTDVAGWQIYNVTMMANGKVPYRDFYCYIPIAYLFRLLASWTTVGHNWLLSRFVCIGERILIFEVIYLILCRWIKPGHAWFCTALSYVFFIKAGYDALGDYTQMSDAVGVLCIYCFIRFAESLEQKEQETLLPEEKSGKRSPYLWLIAAYGLAMTIVFVKQSYGLVAVAAMACFLLCYLICTRCRHFFKVTGSAVLGYALGAAPWIAYLYFNDALQPFIEQIFLGAMNSKGFSTGSSASDSMFLKLFQAIFSWQYLLIGAAFLLALMIHDYVKHEKVKKILTIIIAATGLIGFLTLCVLEMDGFEKTLAALWGFGPVKIVVLLMMIFLAWLLYSQLPPDRCAVAGGAILFAGFCSISFMSSSEIQELCETNTLSTLMQVITHSAVIATIALCFRYLLREFLEKGRDREGWEKFIFLVIGLAFAMAALIGNGTFSFSSGSVAFICVPAVLGMIQQKTDGKLPGKILTGTMVVLFTLLFTIGVAEKLESPYSWWGWSSETLSDNAYYTIDYPMFDGLKVDKKTKVTIEQVSKLIEENSDEDDFVFIFPYSVIYRLTTDRMSVPTFTPVYFFDVCSDDAARSDLEIIEDNLPKVIVWKDLGETCWTTHERLFRSGNRLGQRDIQDWFNSVKDTEYTLVGKVYNESVYVLNDGTEPAYTYFAESSDLVSRASEVEDTTVKYDWLDIFTGGSLGDSLDDYHMISFIAVVLICIPMLFAGGLWESLTWLIAGVYCTQNADPVLLLGMYLPMLGIMFCEDREQERAKRTIGIMLGIDVLLYFTSLTTMWQSGTAYAVAIYTAFLGVFALVHCIVRRHYELAWWHLPTDGKWIVAAAVVFSIVICNLGISDIHAEQMEPTYRAHDEQIIQDVCEKLTELRAQTDVRASLDGREEGVLPDLGGNGEKVEDVVSVLKKMGYNTSDISVRFVSKVCKRGYLYVRMSGDTVTVWLQNTDTSGNSGWAVRVTDEDDATCSLNVLDYQTQGN